MTASFPWYDLPSVQWANDALWRATGLGGRLERATPPEAQWRSEDLVVSQACGLDLFLSDAPITPVLAPVFDLDCEAGCYYSYLVGSREGVAAVNAPSSRSGWSALLTLCEPTSVIVTGSHVASLAAVRGGAADLACIDAVTWHILARDMPAQVRGLRPLDRSRAAPAPPFVVRRAADPNALAAPVTGAITAAVNDPATVRARQALLLRGVVPVTMADYAPILKEYREVVARVPPAAIPLTLSPPGLPPQATDARSPCPI